uniref:MORN repeat-containing protein 3 n=1 Tax=Timema monikensis TaxID=170555 RepID=A0A7R9HQ60_9NEOP|nr:unnamed protein product [Timema monikensis]
MPFLKFSRRVEPLWKENERLTFKIGLHHTIYSISGDRYIGEWLSNHREGKGAHHLRTNKLYEGDWKNDSRHGYGILSTKRSDGTYSTTYAGEWRNGRRHGIGVCHYNNGDYYEGRWKNKERSGHGRMWFSDGAFYEGEWLNDKFHGIGLFVQENGNRYEGEWKNGLKHGHGKFFHLDSGQLQEGLWYNGVSVTSVMVDMYYRQATLQPTKYPIPKVERLLNH